MTDHAVQLVCCALFLLLMVPYSLQHGNTTQAVSCDDYECMINYECDMVSITCDTPPCRKTPMCRLKCNGTVCASGLVCQKGHCMLDVEPVVDFCIIFYCPPGLHCSRGKCTAGPLCEGIKCGPDKDCYIVNRRICSARALNCDDVPTPVCELPDYATGHFRLVHYILGITFLYFFLMTNFCIYLAFKKCRRKRQVGPSIESILE